jgi:autophagy-related protein 5
MDLFTSLSSVLSMLSPTSSSTQSLNLQSSLSPSSSSSSASSSSHSTSLNFTPSQTSLFHALHSGTVPVLFTLASNEIITTEKVFPVTSLVSRLLYWPLYSKQIRDCFLSFTPVHEDELWFEDTLDGIPLNWMIPIGVVVDILCARRSLTRLQSSINSSSATKPSLPSSSSSKSSSLQFSENDFVLNISMFQWPFQVTSHFQNFPRHSLPRCQYTNDQSIRRHLTHTIREAVYLRYGYIKMLQQLSPTEHTELLDTLLSHNFEKYTAILQKLFSAIPNHEYWKYVPTRVYFVNFWKKEHEEKDMLWKEQQWIATQRPLPPFRENEHNQRTLLTLKDVFQQCVSTAVFESLSLPSLSYNVCALIQGITIPLSTPLYWLALHASHPDLFLYIVFVKSPM